MTRMPHILIIAIMDQRIDPFWRFFIRPQRRARTSDHGSVVLLCAPFGGEEVVPPVNLVDVWAFGDFAAVFADSQNTGWGEGTAGGDVDFAPGGYEVRDGVGSNSVVWSADWCGGEVDAIIVVKE